MTQEEKLEARLQRIEARLRRLVLLVAGIVDLQEMHETAIERLEKAREEAECTI